MEPPTTSPYACRAGMFSSMPSAMPSHFIFSFARLLTTCALLAGMAATWASEPTTQCSVAPGQPDTHEPSCSQMLAGHALEVQAEAGQVLLWTLDSGTHAHTVRLMGPDGQLLRHWPAVHNGIQDIGWVTPTTGRYRLEAHNPFFTQPDMQPDVEPIWQLKTSGPALADAAPAAVLPAAVQSPALLQLQAQIAQTTPAQKPVLIQEFWSAALTHGAPLLEPLPQHPQEALVTFLWRAPAGTQDLPHHVRLEWAMRSADPFTFQRLPDTDIWYLSLPLPRGLRAAYQLVVDPVQWPTALAAGAAPSRMQRVQTQQLSAQRDLLNPHHWHAGSPELPADSAAALHAERSVLEIAATGPLRNMAADNAPPTSATKLPAGQLQHLRYTSALLGNTRSLSLYLPTGSHAAGSLPLLVLFDREAYLERVHIHQLLDAWIAQGRLPAMAVLLVGNPQRKDRAAELPPHTPAFGNMLAHELLPWLRAQQPAIATEARQVVVAGSSYGGLAAGWLGWAHPETFGNVLSLSGSYWWAPSTPKSEPAPHRWAEGDWFMRQVLHGPTQAVRWHLAYGLLERGVQGEAGIIDNNRHLRNVLQAKGYTVTTHEFAGGHDYYAWGEEIALGLEALLGTATQPR